MTATKTSNAGKHRSKTGAILSASWLLFLVGPASASAVGVGRAVAAAAAAFAPPSTPCRRRGGRTACDGLTFKLLAEDDHADPTLKPPFGSIRSSCDSNNKTRKQRANINKNKNKRKSKRSLATAAASFALLQLGTPPGALFLGGSAESARMAVAGATGGAPAAPVAVCSSRGSSGQVLHARGGHVGKSSGAAPVVAAKSADVAGSKSSGGKIGSMKRVVLVSGGVAAVSTIYVRKRKSGAKAGDDTELAGKEEDAGEEDDDDDDGRTTFDSVMGNEDGDDEKDVEAGSSADIDAANPAADVIAGRSDGSSNIVDSDDASANNNGRNTNNNDGNRNIVDKSPFSLSRAEKIQKERILNMVADAVATEKEAKSREKARARERGRAAVAQVGSIESEKGEREDADAAGPTKPTDGKRTVKSDEDFMDDILMETDLAI